MQHIISDQQLNVADAAAKANRMLNPAQNNGLLVQNDA